MTTTHDRHGAIYTAVVFTCCTLASSAGAQSVLHVDAHATGPIHDGASWCGAFTTLDEALTAAIAGDTILVAQGTYQPDPTGLADPRDATFTLVDGVVLEGGYAGCGTIDPNLRDIRVQETILSGDLAGDDGPDFSNNTENTVHVVTGVGGSSTTVLDGFTITGGHADGVCCGPSANGGGMYLSQCDATIVNCTFEANSASRGGGLFNDGGAPQISHCVFTGNRAVSSALASGGGFYSSNGTPTLSNCLFVQNQSGINSPAGFGGAMTVFSGQTTLQNCTLADNSATDSGGGIFVAGDLTILDNIVWDNQDQGGTNHNETAQLFVSSGTIIMDFTCIQGLTGSLGGTGNIDVDPSFAPGPAGCYYLSQTAVGPGGQSPCVDAGSDTAANLGMDTTTTRGDEVTDTTVVDMGFHHPVTGAALVMGDFDRSGRVDLFDVAQLQLCFTNPGPVAVPSCCRIFDLDGDLDVDLDDYAALQPTLLGP